MKIHASCETLKRKHMSLNAICERFPRLTDLAYNPRGNGTAMMELRREAFDALIAMAMAVEKGHTVFSKDIIDGLAVGPNDLRP